MLLYNLFPLLAGPFRAWTPHLQRAAELGFDWIFVNPIQKPGRSGSLYSIADYFAINPVFADPKSKATAEQDLKVALAMSKRLGLRAMVDLVINHCAYDAEITRQHPEWFVREGGHIVHPHCIDHGEKVVWHDLALFDHRHTSDPEGLYGLFQKVVEYLIGLGFEGFRCDAAYQVPGNTWSRLIRETKARHPGTIFAAETLGCTADQTKRTAGSGFDYVFNSSKYWDFHATWLLEQYQMVRDIAPSISFPESHDTERLFQETGGNVAAMKQRYLFSALFSAGVMMPMGFEFGFRRRVNVATTKPSDWESGEVQLGAFIRKVNDVKARYALFREECPTMVLPYDNPNVLLLWKASSQSREEALIILNKDTWNHQRFYTENVGSLIQAGSPVLDVSPEFPLDFVPRPFSYDLRPGQAIVLVASRDHP